MKTYVVQYTSAAASLQTIEARSAVQRPGSLRAAQSKEGRGGISHVFQGSSLSPSVPSITVSQCSQPHCLPVFPAPLSFSVPSVSSTTVSQCFQHHCLPVFPAPLSPSVSSTTVSQCFQHHCLPVFPAPLSPSVPSPTVSKCSYSTIFSQCSQHHCLRVFLVFPAPRSTSLPIAPLSPSGPTPCPPGMSCGRIRPIPGAQIFHNSVTVITLSTSKG
ncbi:unnamed protein product [Boreogadus saida]